MYIHFHYIPSFSDLTYHAKQIFQCIFYHIKFILHFICYNNYTRRVAVKHANSRQLLYHSISSNWIFLSQPTIGLKVPFMGQ